MPVVVFDQFALEGLELAEEAIGSLVGAGDEVEFEVRGASAIAASGGDTICGTEGRVKTQTAATLK